MAAHYLGCIRLDGEFGNHDEITIEFLTKMTGEMFQ